MQEKAMGFSEMEKNQRKNREMREKSTNQGW
jgi:hypothetical protein